jgi:hypothetical protein
VLSAPAASSILQLEMESKIKQTEDQLLAIKKEVNYLKEQMQATQEYSTY